MFRTLREDTRRDTDYSQRVFDLTWRERVRDGKLYDGLPNAFHEEKNSSGEYVELRKRRPSVRYNLCASVVDDAVSLLFSEGHFPTVRCSDKDSRDWLKRILSERGLQQVMIDAATKGSVGSVCIHMAVLSGKLFFKALDSKYLTPDWAKDDPERLVSVVEEYKVSRQALEDAGIQIPVGKKYENEKEFWWRCEWTDKAEVHYFPQTKADHKEGVKPREDKDRSVRHNLGFVPMVWVKNLPGGDGVDGKPTFSDECVDSQIELEYLLSQTGRGLKYSMDPTLLIKEPAIGESGEEIVKGGGNALVVSQDGDAKLLEINGTATEAALKFIAKLREITLEGLKGRSADPAKLSAARSAKAMELLNQPLIWLADKMRGSYGQYALLELLRMVVKASHKMPLKLNDDEKLPKLAKEPLSLHWPSWYPLTADEKQTHSNTAKTLVDSGIISSETMTEVTAPLYDVEDVPQELKRVEQDRQRLYEKEKAQAQVKITA